MANRQIFELTNQASPTTGYVIPAQISDGSIEAVKVTIANLKTALALTKTDISLSNVDNTTDANKPVSTAQATAIATVQSDIDTHEANVSNPHSVTKTQVGLGSVDNTSDASKPVSTAQQTALNLKANIASPTFTGTVSGISKGMVGLGNVDNTTDVAKPVSTLQQSALNAKQDTLVSATNIKTINSQTLLGSGDLVIAGGGGTWGSITGTLSSQSDLNSALGAKQATLVSATNIKTINSTSLLGSGNINIPIYNEPLIRGSILNKTTFSSLTGFTNNGATASVSGGKLVVSGPLLGWVTQTVDADGPTCTEFWRQKIQYTVNQSSGASTYGIGLGIRSLQTGDGTVLAWVNLTTGSGKLTFTNFSGTLVTGTTSLTYSNGDDLELVVERAGNIMTATARNVTTNSTPITLSFTFSTSTISPVLPNTGKFAIFSIDNVGTYSVSKWSIDSQEVKNADIALVGDSKFVGYTADFDKRLASLLKTNVQNVIVLAGGGDKSQHVTARLAEIIALSPKAVLLDIGTNNGAGDSAQVLSDYATITSGLQAAGIEVYYTVAYQSGDTYRKTFVDSTYPSNHIIDTWTSLQQTGALSDGVHSTNYGNLLSYNEVLKSSIIKNTKSPSNSNFISTNINLAEQVWVDTSGNDSTGAVGDPSKPFLTLNAALDATAALPTVVIILGIGDYAAPTPSKLRSNMTLVGVKIPEYNNTITSTGANTITYTAPTKLVNGSVLKGSFPFSDCQNVTVMNLGIDTGSDWVGLGNPESDGISATTTDATIPIDLLKGIRFENIITLASSAASLVHGLLLQNCDTPILRNIRTYFGYHGIALKCTGLNADGLFMHNHGYDALIIKDDTYALVRNNILQNVYIYSNDNTLGGMLIEDFSTNGVKKTILTNVVIDGTAFGIKQIGQGGSPFCSFWNISNVQTFNLGAGNSMEFAGIRDSHITNCQLDKNMVITTSRRTKVENVTAANFNLTGYSNKAPLLFNNNYANGGFTYGAGVYGIGNYGSTKTGTIGVPTETTGLLAHESQFIGANGTLLPAYTPEAGFSWVAYGTTNFEIQSNRASAIPNGTSGAGATTDAGSSNYVITTVGKMINTGFLQIWARFIDANNFVAVHLNGTNVTVYEIVAGVASSIIGTSWVPGVTDHTYEVTLSGNAILVKADGGTVVGAQPLPSGVNNGGTFVGIGMANSNTNGDVSFDSFIVV